MSAPALELKEALISEVVSVPGCCPAALRSFIAYTPQCETIDLAHEEDLAARTEYVGAKEATINLRHC